MTLSTAQRNSLESATIHYQAAVNLAAPYLTSRGIPEHVARIYRLGYVNEPILGHEHLAGRLVIPYLTRAGVVDMKFRCTQNHDCKLAKCTKYLGYGGISTRPFNPEAILGNTTGTVGIAEGEIDAIILTAMCGIQSVGIPGVSNWKPRYGERFGWEDFKEVFIFADNDDAGEGKQFARQIAKSIERAIVIELPPGHDVNSYYSVAGVDGILRLIGRSAVGG